MNHLEQFKNIHTLIFDVDGVLTDSKLLILENGQLLRQMNTRDGFALKEAVRQGLRVCIITGGRSKGVIVRLKGLGITDIYIGVEDKLKVYKEFVKDYDLDEEGILFMGDDIPDYQLMRNVALPTCPQDAVPELLSVAKYISPYKGGQGCVRDVIEKVLKLQRKWMK